MDELSAHPELYPGAFVQQHEQTSPTIMRQPTSWIDESSLAALAEALKMPIEVCVMNGPYQTLPLRLVYNAKTAESPKVVIQLQANHYMPHVVMSERFALVRSQPVAVLKPVVESQPNEPSMAQILARISAEETRVVKIYEDAIRRLTAAVVAEEVDKEFLLNLYVQHMPKSDYLSGRVKHICAELGHEYFRKEIERVQAGQSEGRALASPDRLIIDQLIQALARSISIGQSDDIFDKIEAHSSRHTTSLRGL